MGARGPNAERSKKGKKENAKGGKIAKNTKSHPEGGECYRREKRKEVVWVNGMERRKDVNKLGREKNLVGEKILRRDGKHREARSQKEAKRKNKREMDKQRKQRKKE